jgi:Ca-activated chloride channel family protein
MRWGSPELFFVLLAPLLAVGAWLYGSAARRRAIARAGDAPLVARLLAAHLPQRRLARQALLGLALTLLCVAALRPQLGRRPEALRRTGVDIAVAFDISKSMLVKDVLPSRLEAARQRIGELMSRLNGDRVALVPFAGVAFTQSPLTADNSAIRLYLQSLDPNQMPVGGTNLAAAIDEGVKVLTGRGDKAETSGRSQVLLLVTDGEDVASTQGEAAKKAAQKAAEAGIRIYAIGLGTMTGDPIPLYNNSGQHAGYQQDSTGKPIYSKLNLKLLEELARLSDPANPNETRVFLDDGKTAALEGMLGALEKQQRTTLEASIKHQYGERFQLLLIPALLLLLIEMRLSERRRAAA